MILLILAVLIFTAAAGYSLVLMPLHRASSERNGAEIKNARKLKRKIVGRPLTARQGMGRERD